jgi:hypothetical protein
MAETLKSKLQTRLIKNLHGSRTRVDFESMLAAFYHEDDKGLECERCNTYQPTLTEPISMPNGGLKRVCSHCLAEIKPVGGRPVYVKR